MTLLETILLAVIWIILGTFISYKRSWYNNNDYNDMPQESMVVCNILFAPIALFIALFKEFILDEWNNKK